LVDKGEGAGEGGVDGRFVLFELGRRGRGDKREDIALVRGLDGMIVEQAEGKEEGYFGNCVEAVADTSSYGSHNEPVAPVTARWSVKIRSGL